MPIRHLALEMLLLRDPAHKAAAVRAMPLEVAGTDCDAVIAEPPGVPGRPQRPTLVAPDQLRQRRVGTLQGRASLIHALAHIESNAIDLALDLVWRFAGMPQQFYSDWLQVAHEEALHFQLLTEHLRTLGFAYGDFPAHDGLWEMAQRTRGDLLARLALVPRTLEARGLDAAPPIRAKLASVGDQRGAEILDIILRDEIGHVAIGNHWYRWLCERDGLDPVAHYEQLALTHQAPRLRGPHNIEARLAAGFTQGEVEALPRG